MTAFVPRSFGPFTYVYTVCIYIYIYTYLRVIPVFDSFPNEWDGITSWQRRFATIACREAEFSFAVVYMMLMTEFAELWVIIPVNKATKYCIWATAYKSTEHGMTINAVNLVSFNQVFSFIYISIW